MICGVKFTFGMKIKNTRCYSIGLKMRKIQTFIDYKAMWKSSQTTVIYKINSNIMKLCIIKGL